MGLNLVKKEQKNAADYSAAFLVYYYI